MCGLLDAQAELARELTRHADERTVTEEQDLDLGRIRALPRNPLQEGRDRPLIDRGVDRALRGAHMAGSLGIGDAAIGQLDRTRGRRQPRLEAKAPEHLRPLEQVLVVGDKHAALTRAEPLVLVEAKGRTVAQRAGLASVVRRAVGLAGVSITLSPCLRATARTGSMSTGRPCRWTTRTALVLGVTAASTWATSMCTVS